MCRRHGEDRIGICGDRRHELLCGKVGCTPQLLKDAHSVKIDRMPSQRVSTGTRCPEVLKVKPRTVGDSEAFRGRGTTNVSSADEQYVTPRSSYDDREHLNPGDAARMAWDRLPEFHRIGAFMAWPTTAANLSSVAESGL